MSQMKETLYQATPTQHDPQQTRWQLEVIDILADLEHDLKGEVWDSDTSKYKQVGEPRVNEIGLRDLMSFVRTHVNKVSFLTNLNEDDVNQICQEARVDLAELLLFNWQEYKIEKTNLNTLVEMIDHFIFLALMRSKDEGERIFLGKTYSRADRVITGDSQQKKSWLPMNLGGK